MEGGDKDDVGITKGTVNHVVDPVDPMKSQREEFRFAWQGKPIFNDVMVLMEQHTSQLAELRADIAKMNLASSQQATEDTMLEQLGDTFKQRADTYKQCADTYKQCADLYRQYSDMYMQRADLFKVRKHTIYQLEDMVKLIVTNSEDDDDDASELAEKAGAILQLCLELEAENRESTTENNEMAIRNREIAAENRKMALTVEFMKAVALFIEVKS